MVVLGAETVISEFQGNHRRFVSSKAVYHSGFIGVLLFDESRDVLYNRFLLLSDCVVKIRTIERLRKESVIV